MFAKFLGFLGFVAALLFLWAGWKDTFVWNFDADFYYKHVVVFSLLMFGSVFCGCCGKGKMVDGGMGMGGMCKHDTGCTCGDCGKCR